MSEYASRIKRDTSKHHIKQASQDEKSRGSDNSYEILNTLTSATAIPNTLNRSQIVQLQRSIGNKATLRLLQRTDADTPSGENKILSDKKVKSAQDFYAEHSNLYHPAVIQKIQAALGIAETGVMDVATIQAIAKYQKEQKVSIDGKAGQKTLDKLVPGLTKKTGYVSVNTTSGEGESKALQDVIGDDLISVTNTDSGEGFDTPEKIEAWISGTLGIDEKTQKSLYDKVHKTLNEADYEFSDQMAGMIKMFWGAEQGNYFLDRLVISGHHGLNHLDASFDSDEIFSDDSDSGEMILSVDLSNISAAFPIAAGQIEDIMFSACNTEHEPILDLLRQAFPNAKTAWVYKGYSPSLAQGSDRHIKKWEKTSRGSNKPQSAGGAVRVHKL